MKLLKKKRMKRVFYSSEDRVTDSKCPLSSFEELIRLLSKFSLKEKPECIQNCVEVSENARDLGQVQREWEKSGLFWCLFSRSLLR